MLRSSTVFRMFAGLVCLVVFITSCTSPGNLSPQGTVSPQSSPTPTRAPTATPLVTATPVPTLPRPASFTDAPFFLPYIQAKALPPVRDRLPENPKVVRTTEKLGEYGGVWQMLIQSISNQDLFLRTVAYEPLVRWTPDWSGIEPNLVERYTVNANATEYVFTLRKGLRWSDGEPFTTEDIRFWYEDVLLNPELTQVIPAWLKSHNDPAQFEFVDEVTFKVHFTYPNSLFLPHLASPDALMITAFPAHYVKQFHARYSSPMGLYQLMAGGGYKTWQELFIKQVGINPLDLANFRDPKRPRLTAWVLQNAYTPTEKEVVWKRNPYYWKVDAQGQQLPYIDTVKFGVIQNADEAINRVINNEIDMQNLSALGIDVAATFGSLKDSSYRMYELTDGMNNVMTIQFNQTSADPIKNKIFNSGNFRIALSYAIDRQEMIRVLFQGQGKPWQAAPRQGSPFYNEEMGTQYTEFSLEKANSYLDQAGLYKDSFGNRLGPDGMPITFSIEVLDSEPQQIAMLNLIAKYWSAIGIEAQPKPESRQIFNALVRSNQHDAAAWNGGSTYLYDVLLDPSNYLPANDNAYWAILWANRYNGVAGYDNIRVGNAVRTSMDMYDRIRSVSGLKDQVRYMNGALAVAREGFWIMGIAQGPTSYGLVRKNLRNVMEKMPSAWMYPDPGPANPEQFFFEQNH